VAPDGYHLGCTGTQDGMTQPQLATAHMLLRDAFRVGYRVFHHGDCVGADEEFAGLAHALGFYVIGHPCDIEPKRAFFPSDETLPVKRPMDRNDDIVASSRWILAGPSGRTEERRSGTWATVRRARKACQGLILIYPQGDYETEVLWNLVHDDIDMV
jgi:hypothetical protein